MRQIESLFWGIIAALGALFIEVLIYIGYSSFSPANELSFNSVFILPQFILIAAFIEEAFKYLIISKRIELYSLEKSYLINSLFVGFGFFLVEMGLIANSSTLPPLQTILELAIIHIGTAGIIGYIVAIKNPKKFSTFLYAAIIATILHSGYNFLILDRQTLENYLIISLLFFLIAKNIGNFFMIKKKLS